MTFIPRMHENGGICCSAEGALCDKCKAYFAVTRTAALRTAVPKHSYTPPDPYADGVAALRKDLPPAPVAHPSPCPMEDPSYKPGNGSSPDPYKIALQHQKENR